MKYFDNTMLASAKKCKRHFYLRHVKNWRSAGTAAPLAFGAAWHSAMNPIWTLQLIDYSGLLKAAMVGFLKTWEEELPEELRQKPEFLKFRNTDTAIEMLASYIAQRADWIRAHVSEVQAELPFCFSIDDFFYIGRKDKLAVVDGRKTIIEHKTTSDYRKDGGFSPDFMDQFELDSQILGYITSEGVEEPTRVLVDGALVHANVHDRFRFIPVDRSRPELEMWLGETTELIHEISTRVSTGLGARLFPRNTESCFGRYGRCPFFDICRFTANPDTLDGPPDGFIVDKWEPFDFHELQKAGYIKQEE